MSEIHPYRSKNFRDKSKPYYYLRTDSTGKKRYDSPIDSTGVRTFNYLKPEYYKSADLTDGAADIACDMNHWRSQNYNYYFKASSSDGSYTDLTLNGSSNLYVYFWYSPDDDVKNNGSMFYAYKNMDDLQKEEDMDAAEKKITSGKYTLELLDGTKPKYGTYNDEDNYRNFNGYAGYNVTLQLKKDGTPDRGEGLADGGSVGDDYTYQCVFKYKFASENADDNDLNELIIDYEGGNSSNWLSDVDNENKPGQSNYFLPASNANVKKFYLYSYLKLMSGDYTKEYLIDKKVYDAEGAKPKVDRECSTSIRYPSYLDGDVTGYGEDRVYDDLTGLLKKEWTGGPKFEEAKKGKVWRNGNSRYYQVTGGTTLSQTIEADKLPADESEYDPNTYTLQAIVRGEKGAKINLDLTHGDMKAHATVRGLYENDNTHSTIDHNGCVDTIYTVLSDDDLKAMGFEESDIPKGGWQKIEATVGSGENSDSLGITISSDKHFDLADVVLLLNANKNDQSDQSHFLTTVPAIAGDTTGEYFSDDGDKLNLTSYKKFSFFDRGPNINRIVEMARGTVMNYVNGAESRYMPFNVVLPKINSLDGKMIYRLFLKDSEPYFWYTNDDQSKTVECNYISYDREFTAGKPSTIALPFTVPMDVIFDWCTNGGYNAVKGKHSWTPSSADQNWGVLYNVTDDGQVQLGQTWGYNSDGTIGGTLRTSGDSNAPFYGPIMYLKTVKNGKPFMGMKSNDNRALALCASNVTITPNPNPTNIETYTPNPIVYCHKMSYNPVSADGSNADEYGVRQNENDYNFFVGSFKRIDDLANVRNTESFADMKGNDRTYHFYYWSAKDYKFKKVSEETEHKKVSCAPFRAFLAIGQKSGDSNPAKESLGMRFVDFYGSGTTTGIKDITTPSARMQSAANNVYSMTGVLVRRGTSLAGLPNGLYIVNGKKVIVNHN